VQHPLDHIGIAVPSIPAALPVFELLSGVAGSRIERVESQGVDVAFVGGTGCLVELIEPIRPDSPVARFIERRGPGLHHIAYRVSDLAAELERLVTQGFELIDRQPRAGAHGRRVAFIHPRSTNGVLTELVEAAGPVNDGS